MGEPIIVCPKCHSDIPLTESLAAPLLAAIRRDYERRIADKDREIAERAETLHRQQADLEKARGDLDQQVSDKVRAERKRASLPKNPKRPSAWPPPISIKRTKNWPTFSLS
jgi:hypothetical protein